MEQGALKQKILELVSGKPHVSVLATVVDGKPWARYLMAWNVGTQFYFATSLASRKVQHIKGNNQVHLTFMIMKPNGDPEEYFQIAGKAVILTDLATRKQFWNDMYKRYFKGPDDPQFVIVRIDPSHIEMIAGETMMPEVLEL